MSATAEAPPPAPGALARYFLRLGTIGFGGPIALVGAMQRDLVERRRWVSSQVYLEGLALAQLMPGPLAAQLAIYLGWSSGRVWGASLVALSFVLPSFLMVLALSALYVRYGGLPWMVAAFYGMGPATIAIIARGATQLARTTLGRDRLLWLVFVANALMTAWTGRELVWGVIAGGVLVIVARGWPALPAPMRVVAAPAWGWLVTGLHGAAGGPVLLQVATFFAKAGILVFGSGLAIVPFLRAGVVDEFHWLNDRQFLDAVAVAMITPGPVVITVAFIGFLVAGTAGAVVAALGVFLPCYLLVVLPAPYFRVWIAKPRIALFVRGITAGAAGAIAGAVWVLGRRTIVDPPTALIGAVALALILMPRKLSEPLVILLAGAVGLALGR